MVSKKTIDVLKAIKNEDSIAVLSTLQKNKLGLTYTMIGKSIGWSTTQNQRTGGLSYLLKKLIETKLIQKEKTTVAQYAEFSVYKITKKGEAVGDIMDMLEWEIVEKSPLTIGVFVCEECRMEIEYEKTPFNNAKKYCSVACRKKSYKGKTRTTLTGSNTGQKRGWNLNHEVSDNV